MANRLEGSLLFEHMGARVFQNECLDMKIVCSPGMPEHQPFQYGWGAKASVARDWLIAEILGHLQAEKANLAVVEDPCASPSDPFLIKADSPIWFYKERVLWPITQDMMATGTGSLKGSGVFTFGLWSTGALGVRAHLVISEEDEKGPLPRCHPPGADGPPKSAVLSSCLNVVN
jgi:hypothetical protein